MEPTGEQVPSLKAPSWSVKAPTLSQQHTSEPEDAPLECSKLIVLRFLSVGVLAQVPPIRGGALRYELEFEV